jgi:hypothetical protein
MRRAHEKLCGISKAAKKNTPVFIANCYDKRARMKGYA